jgi:alanine racemase
VPVAQQLELEPSVCALGVATLEEGIELRRNRIQKPIWVFSECTPFREEFAQICARYALVPVLHQFQDLRRCLSYRVRFPNLQYQLKFNTGLNRLGIDPSEAGEVRRLLVQTGLGPQGVCTHFAEAENPKSALTRAQVRAFRALVGDFGHLVGSYIHSANSAALLEEKHLQLGGFCNSARPGLAVYGYGHSPEAAANLEPALTWAARVLIHRRLAAGDRVGYGGTFRAAKPMASSVLALGYGDGFPRLLSNQPLLLDGATRRRVLGRVSMDLTVVTGEYPADSWVTLIGDGAGQATTLARASKTIVYEILTSISPRVPRVYELD